MSKPKRGEVWCISFDPSIGGEVQKTRPAIIISNDMANKHLNRVQIIPVTSNVSKLYPAETYITLNGEKSKAMADQLTTASKARLQNKFGKLSQTDLAAVEHAVRTQLDLH